MRVVRRVQINAGHGNIYEFNLDIDSPDDPELSHLRRYYVVSSGLSASDAYCCLAAHLGDSSLCHPASPWLSLYRRVFGPVTHDQFLKIIRSVERGECGDYAFFTDEQSARLALLNFIRGASAETPRGVKAAAAFQYSPVGGGSPVTEATQLNTRCEPLPSRNTRATSMATDLLRQTEQFHDAQRLIQEGRTHRKEDVALLQEEVRSLKQRFHSVSQRGLVQNDFDALPRETECVMKENALLKHQYSNACMELGYWREECQALRRRLNEEGLRSEGVSAAATREQYKDLERRHQILLKEVDELSQEKRELEERLHHSAKEAARRNNELTLALQALNTLGRGLDNVQHKLPFLLQSEEHSRFAQQTLSLT
uniref:Uncharacterized protein TCIL3000_9_5470 n=1 Tax=Trypanosoma congolense (strain IL3000) TaxID=1068625 RepID=G0UUS5_TRYCI|nr:unnamed protein product [Trypanosoma congolense IL3000]